MVEVRRGGWAGEGDTYEKPVKMRLNLGGSEVRDAQNGKCSARTS